MKIHMYGSCGRWLEDHSSGVWEFGCENASVRELEDENKDVRKIGYVSIHVIGDWEKVRELGGEWESKIQLGGDLFGRP